MNWFAFNTRRVGGHRKEKPEGQLVRVQNAQTGQMSWLEIRKVRSVLEFRRWEDREGPFRGFGSPPGKF